MGRVTDRSAFNTPVAPYKRVGRSRPKRDAIGVALGLIQVAKGVGPLVDAAAAGISGAVAKGERADAIEAEKQKRLAQEAKVKARQDAIAAEKARVEERAQFGPGFTSDVAGTPQLSLRPGMSAAMLGRDASTLFPGGAPKLTMPGETRTTPTPGLSYGVPARSVMDAPTIVGWGGLGDMRAVGRTGSDLSYTEPGPIFRPQLPVDPSSDPSLLGRVPGSIPVAPTPPQVPPVATPGVVYPPGTPGEPPKPAMPVPAGTVAGRFYQGAENYRKFLEQTRGTAIPAMEDLLKMSLDELRTLAKFGLSADPRRRVDELRRIGQASTIVGRVEKAPGLMGLISGTRGGEAGRKYALQLATKEKPQPDALSIAGKMAGLELTGERIDAARRKRLKKRGGGRRGPSRGFQMLYYKDEELGVWKEKYKDKKYWEGRDKERKAFERAYARLSPERKYRYSRSADSRNKTILRARPKAPKPVKPPKPVKTPEGVITGRRDAQTGLNRAKSLGIKVGTALDSGTVKKAQAAITAELRKKFVAPKKTKDEAPEAYSERLKQLRKDRKERRDELQKARTLLDKYRQMPAGKTPQAPAPQGKSKVKAKPEAPVKSQPLVPGKKRTRRYGPPGSD